VIEKYTRDALIFFATLDPFTTLSVFVALTAERTAAERRKIAFKATLYSACILGGAVAIGQVILAAMDISLAAFSVAGGIVLFMFGAQMIFGQATHAGDQADPTRDIAVFPLAVPTIAGPGAIMAAILRTDNDVNTISVQVVSAVILLAVLLLSYAAMLGASFLIRVIGTTGASIIVRIMGMILSSLAVESVIRGLATMFHWQVG
jgi:multiple antibiotic resistance protein